MNLSIITATRDRPAWLAVCLTQFRRQSLGGLAVEHLVVTDGPDPAAAALAAEFGARCVALPEPRGAWGAYAKDLGVQQASGDYVCFWDDDNVYEPHALAVLYAAACGTDVGLVQTRHRRDGPPRLVPAAWDGRFHFGDVDTMCVCVRRDLARRHPWGDADPAPGTDFRWLARLQADGAVVRFVPIVIGEHL